MGTTTFYLRNNDLKKNLKDMTKEELENLDLLSPYKEEKYILGWHAPLELHNGNIYPLIFWKGKLIRLNDAPSYLKRKYYNKFSGKHINKYEWTVLKEFLLNRRDAEIILIKNLH